MANLLVNEGFENDGTGWTVTLGSPIFTGALGTKEGVKAMHVQDELFVMAQSPALAVAAGDRIYFNAWVKPLTTGSFAVTGAPGPGGIGITIVLDVDGTIRVYDRLTSELLKTSVATADKDGFYALHLSTLAPNASAVVSLGFAQPAGVIITGESAVTGEWLVDDCWLATTPVVIPAVMPENSQGEQEFLRSLVDPITGRMAKEDMVSVDIRQRNRITSDIDEFDRDDLNLDWTPRTEHEPMEP